MLKRFISELLHETPKNHSHTLSSSGTPDLNFKKSLLAHDEWEAKLEQELAGTSDSKLDLVDVASDCQCHLGIWLHGAGKDKYAKRKEYKNAFKAHTDFHNCAAEIVIEHQSGNTQYAKTLLKTKFKTVSNLNQLQLVRLFSIAN